MEKKIFYSLADKRSALLILIGMALGIAGFAQQSQTIKGTVMSQDDMESIPGVSVLVKGTQRGTVTDLDGVFQVQATAGEVLVISFVGWPLMRYAEVLLIYAEASNEASGPTIGAYEAVNKLRRRAELPELEGMSQSEFREAVWRERWYELSFENKTWYDMARLRKAFNVETREFEDFVGHQFSYGPTLQERELLFPIPTAEIRNNSKLTQNPGY